jgi:hypothetical protein
VDGAARPGRAGVADPSSVDRGGSDGGDADPAAADPGRGRGRGGAVGLGCGVPDHLPHPLVSPEFLGVAASCVTRVPARSLWGSHRPQRTVSAHLLTHRDRVTPFSRRNALLSPPPAGAGPRPASGWVAASKVPASDGAYRDILINRRSTAVSTDWITSSLAPHAADWRPGPTARQDTWLVRPEAVPHGRVTTPMHRSGSCHDHYAGPTRARSCT